MENTLGSISFQDEKIVLKYNEGYKETFERNKPDYSEGSQWIEWDGEKYFLKRN